MSTPTRVPNAAFIDSSATGTRLRAALPIALAALVVSAIVVWIVAFSSVLGVKTVSVRGADAQTIVQVRAAAAIRHGTPLVRLDAAAVVGRVEALPVVASASVHTSFPNTVVITVLERVALGYLESGNRFILMDKTGTQFRSVSVRPTGLPLFAMPAGPQAQATGEAMASVAASLPSALLIKIASIQAFDPTAITLLLADQRVVAWGSADRNADKARILPALLTQPGTRFDVSDPDQVFAH